MIAEDAAIRVERLGKRYRVGELQRYKSLRDTIMRSARSTIDGSARAKKTDFWALRDVSFEIPRGQATGIIGRNGAGKSTLLKILSRVTDPTEGNAEIAGRVGSLLEVGTGFHPELTGRENIYLNAAILGMRRAEIARKFDDIVEFSEIGQFLDTAVKYYSSGMYVRLAFAVAAHLEPEILIVDEVLAVGDAAFQKKCLGKMGEVTSGGRTVLFVSHNMGAISRLCDSCIWLEKGQVKMQGPTADVVTRYLTEGVPEESERRWSDKEAPGDDVLRLMGVRVLQNGVPAPHLDITKPFTIEIETHTSRAAKEVALNLRVLTPDGLTVLHTSDVMGGSANLARKPGRRITACELPPFALNAGSYVVSIGADIPNTRLVFAAESALNLHVEGLDAEMGRYDPRAWTGLLGPGIARWSVLREVQGT